MSTPLPDERQPPLYFAGRTDELGLLQSELDALCATGRAPGGLQLVMGVPRVGKTQLAARGGIHRASSTPLLLESALAIAAKAKELVLMAAGSCATSRCGWGSVNWRQ